MNVQGIRINAKNSPDITYTVEFAFIINPNEEKANRVYSIDVEAVDIADAMTKANMILHHEKVQSFLEFAIDNELSLEHVVNSGALFQWMREQPTSVQIFEPEKRKLLYDLTAESVNHMMNNISTEVEDFLRSQQNDS